MKIALLRRLCLVLVLAACLVPAWASSDVTRSSLHWLQMIDAGQYDDSWAYSSSLLRMQKTPDQWLARMKRLRAAYGDLSMRSVSGIVFTKSLQGYPDGSYATVQYRASYFRQRDATESVSLRLEDGQWRPVSYTLR